MTPRKILVLTLAVVVLFGFIFLFERKMPTTSEAQQKRDLIWELPEDQIESIRLDRPDSSVELKKIGPSTWRLVRPDSYPADSGTASDLASQLARLRRAGGESAEARPEDYGLSPAEKSPVTPAPGTPRPAAAPRATIVWKDPDHPTRQLSRTIEFGVDIPGTDATAARVTGGSTVIFVPSTLAVAVKKKADDFKSRDVFGGSIGEITGLDIERGRGRVSLGRRKGVWWLSQPVTDLADGDFAQRLVDELTGLKTVEFVAGADRANLATLGLAPPLYRASLLSGAGKTPASTVVEFGATRSDGNTVYARREGQVFTVSSSIVEDLSKEAVAFREPRLVRFDRANVSAIDGAFGAEKFSVERKDSGWIAGGKPVPAATADDLMSAVLDLKSRNFLEDGAAGALKARQPAGTVTVKLAGNETWTVSLYPQRSDTQALVSGRPGAFFVQGDPTRTLLSQFQKAAPKK
ncbi:MAG TPA: DUF4340 domain-containing protein [Thermoanaerobaculia bacterium]|nr:DUF4340 domain-containing protein [Thermoanaerobaculia bacterium]